MRQLILVLSALAIALPERAQQPELGPANVAGDRAMRNAIRSFNPESARARILVEKPTRACAVRLMEVPVSKEIDKGIITPKNRLGFDSDAGMIATPPIPACPKDGKQARP